MDSDTESSIIIEEEYPTIDLNLVEKAINALLKHELIRQKKIDNDLLANQTVPIWLIITKFKFSDKQKPKPVSIPLKNPLYDPSTEICLITKDPQKTYKEWVRTHEVKHVQKVIGVSKLRKKYIPYEAKRNLCDSYDLFLADERVLPLLPKMLGKYFFKKKKQPIPINISNEKDFKKEILKACHCTYMRYSPGICLSIKIGTTGMTSNQLLENIEIAIPAIIDKIPRKWKNIQSLHIKTPESVSLPIYNCLPDLPIEIDPKDIKKENHKNDDGIEKEIKTDSKDTDDVDNDDSNTDEYDEAEEVKEEEKIIKKRKISKDTASVKFSAAAINDSKKSQVKNSENVITKKVGKKKPLNTKDKGSDNKKEKLSSTVDSEIKKNNTKKGERANSVVKTNTTAKGKETRNMTETKDSKENEKSNNSGQMSDAASNVKKRKKSPKIKEGKSTTDVTSTKEEDKSDQNDLLSKEVSKFIAEQKEKVMAQEKVERNDNNIDVVTNVKNKKKEDGNKTSVKFADNSEKKKIRKKKEESKNDINASSGNNNNKNNNNNMNENKKGEQEKGIGASLKRKKKSSGQNEPKKKNVKLNNVKKET